MPKRSNSVCMEEGQSLVTSEHKKMDGTQQETSFGIRRFEHFVPALSHHPERNRRHEAGSYRTTICYHSAVLSDLPTA